MMFDELNKRIAELRQREEHIQKRSAAIFWFMRKYEFSHMVLPQSEHLLNGWEPKEEELLRFLGTNFTFEELEDILLRMDDSSITTVLTALEMRLGVCEITRKVIDLMSPSTEYEDEDIRFPPPEEIIEMSDDFDLLYGYTLFGLAFIVDPINPIPFPVMAEIAKSKDAAISIQEWALPKLDELYEHYKSGGTTVSQDLWEGFPLREGDYVSKVKLPKDSDSQM